MVRFSLRWLLLFTAWVALLLGMFVNAGPIDAVLIGILGGLMFYFFDRLLRQWRTGSARELAFLAIAFICSTGAIAFCVKMVFEDARYFARWSKDLEAKIHEDQRFERVTARYSGRLDRRTLTMGGIVASRADYDALQQYAQDHFLHFKCTVVWWVGIDPDVSSPSNSKAIE